MTFISEFQCPLGHFLEERWYLGGQQRGPVVSLQMHRGIALSEVLYLFVQLIGIL